MSANIIFINKSEFIQEYPPIPASKEIPIWYKEASSYIDKFCGPNCSHSSHKNNGATIIENGINKMTTSSTIKKCMPVFDSMTVGYFIRLSANVEVYKGKINGEYQTMFSWSKNAPVDSHPMEQIQGYPHSGIHKLGLPKWTNPWIIKTDPGYSCLFVTPFHRDLKFSILPGIVDTDTFNFSVNLPFMLTDPNFEGTIEAGTPIAQIIPFKRDEFSHEVYDAYDYVQKYPDTPLFQEEFPESYKKEGWNKKTYK